MLESKLLSRATRLTRWLLVIASCYPQWLHALVMQPLSLETLGTQAEIVVQGTVRSKVCQQDRAGRIYTRVEVDVTELWKGAVSGSPLLIVHGGGTLGERQATVAGQVDYAIGEEVVAFLVRNDRGEAVTLGLMQGKFHVWKDPVSQAKFVSNPFHGVPPAGSATALQAGAGMAVRPDALGLAELKRRVVEARP